MVAKHGVHLSVIKNLRGTVGFEVMVGVVMVTAEASTVHYKKCINFLKH